MPRTRRTKMPAWVRIVRERATPEERSFFADRAPLRSPRDGYALLQPRLCREEVETFVVVCLDSQHRVIGMSEISRGIVNSTLVHPREVFRIAIALNAAAVIVAHNHPSGDPTPSVDDRTVTEQLVKSGQLLTIPVHDHLIVCEGRYTSFAEAGLL